jgi:hypothetical protein
MGRRQCGVAEEGANLDRYVTDPVGAGHQSASGLSERQIDASRREGPAKIPGNSKSMWKLLYAKDIVVLLNKYGKCWECVPLCPMR